MKLGSKIYTALIFLFLYAPIIVLIVFSFNDTETASRTVWSGFSLKWYQKLFEDKYILEALRNTLIIAVAAAVFSTIIGTAAAIGINTMKKLPRKLMMNITNFPMVNPEIVTGVSLMLLFVFAVNAMGGKSLGMASLIMAHITFCLPYVILSVMPKLRQMNQNLYEAAQDLGCPPVKAFFKVVLPEIIPGIVTGFIMAFTLSIDDFVISYFTSGTTQTLPIYIYSMTRKRISPEINALSTILFAVIMLLLIIVNVRRSKDTKKGGAGAMKRLVKFGALFFAVLIAASLSFPAFGAAPEAASTGVTINVYNWGEYISNGTDGSLDVNAEFTRRTGITVNYTTFDSNESLYSKLAGGGADYDIIIPSDYMISKLLQEDMLKKLDMKNIPNFKYIDQKFVKPEYDPENLYSVPYSWGLVGLFYNKEFVKEIPTSWDVLWDEQYTGKILMFDNPRDAFCIAQARLEQRFNTTNPADWEAAAALLKQQKPRVQAYVMDQIFDKMESGEAWLAPYYSGDAGVLVEQNDHIGFIIPEEGTNYFVDAVCIPATSTKQKEAEAYINFLCDPEIAGANMDYVGYSTPENAAKEYLSEEAVNNPIFYPPEDVLEKTQVFVNLPQDTAMFIDTLWAEVKMGGPGQSATLVAIILGFLAVYVAIVIHKKRRRKREGN
ncbi:MAG: extracellular solute-binding protein [Oscillospiraceae bacterium]